MSIIETEYVDVARRFANALMEGKFDVAHSLLSAEGQTQWSVDTLRHHYKEMLDYVEQPVTEIEVMDTLDAWAAKQPGDIGWAYVSMSGNGFVEAVAVVVQSENSALKVRSIEWGRP
nr:orf117EGC148 [uncultured bacterium]